MTTTPKTKTTKAPPTKAPPTKATRAPRSMGRNPVGTHIVTPTMSTPAPELAEAHIAGKANRKAAAKATVAPVKVATPRAIAQNRKVPKSAMVPGSKWVHAVKATSQVHTATIAADGTWTVTTADGTKTEGVKSSTAAAFLASGGGKWSGVVYWKPATS